MNSGEKKLVYLAGQANEYEQNWKEDLKTMPEFDFYDFEFDSDQTSPDIFFLDDLREIKRAQYLVANPGLAPTEATWLGIGYFYGNTIKSPGDFCNKLIIIWRGDRNPKWSIEFVKKAGFVVRSVDEARKKLLELETTVD